VPKNRIIRNKRFVLDAQTELQSLWSAAQGLLTLTYDYSPSVAADEIYKEFIEIAAENFNQLGLARLEYQPFTLGRHPKICPLDDAYLKLRYKNPIMFSHYEKKPKDMRVCSTKSYRSFYDARYYSVFIEGTPGDSIKLPPFAEIKCDTEHKLFQRYGVGVLLHEINHLFGIKHAHMPEETNGILTVNVQKPALNDIKRGEIERLFNLFNYDDASIQVTNYTLTSIFSIQHYRINALNPYRSINETRIAELLDLYQMHREVKENYFYLLEHYAGYPILYTYQDIAALATAIYYIDPDTLFGKMFNFPHCYGYCHLVQGIYRSGADEIKLLRLIDALRLAERFHYPILALENITLNAQISDHFLVDLSKILKVVSLKSYITCSFQKESVIPLTLRADCLLTGRLERVGNFQLVILLSDGFTFTTRTLQLAVEEKNKNQKHRLLLGQKETTHYVKTNDSYINLIDTCQVVALPMGQFVSCHFANDELANNLHLTDCWLQFRESRERNVTFIFSNGNVNKTCDIQFLLNHTFPEDINYTFDVSAANTRNAGNTIYASDIEYKTIYKNGEIDTAFLQKHTRIRRDIQRQDSWGVQCLYYLSIPFSQGILEGMVDASGLPPYFKASIKFLPRLVLCYVDYLNPIGLGLIFFSTVLEGSIKSYFRTKHPVFGEQLCSILLFLGIAELELGFSNLWELIDRPIFWSTLADKLNQLFVQFLFAPVIKTVGYGAGLNLSHHAAALLNEKKEQAAACSSNESLGYFFEKPPIPVRPAFLNSMSIAAQTVFSKKTLKLFSVFNKSLVQQDKKHSEVMPAAAHARY
jgi:hypothetical protein